MLQIQLGKKREVDPATEGLGRTIVGAWPGISQEQAWQSGRGTWKLKVARALEQDELQIIDLNGEVLAVGTITGIIKTGGGRHAVEGEVKLGDARVGHQTTTPHPSRNSVAYF